MSKTIGIVGAGPGGLAAGALLAAQGNDVHIFEKSKSVGGRNSKLKSKGFSWDTGPTFFLMPSVLREIFEATGKKLEDYLELKKIDPLYTLKFPDGAELKPSSDPFAMAKAIGKFSARDADSFWAFRQRQVEKFDSVLPALRKPFKGVKDLIDPQLIKALPYINTKSVYEELSDFFEDERVRLAFTFQAKYLGMSPFDCPSLFTILPHIEHSEGVWHPIGGCSAISEALAKLFKDLGGKLHLSSPITKVSTKGAKISSIQVKKEELKFDDYLMNADFAYGMSELFENKERKKYNDKKLESLSYSCSTFMIYLGLKEKVDTLAHHTICFAQNYRKNVREIASEMALSDDPSIYVHNPSMIDDTLAAEGKSSVYILVPVPNLNAPIDWKKEKSRFRNFVINKIKTLTGTDLEPLIEVEKIVTPNDWEKDYNVYKGATFSLAHSYSQMLQFRPHNHSEDFANLYIVGGGTHPGSGLPTIFQSALIASSLIQAKSAKKPLLNIKPLQQRALNLGLALAARRNKASEDEIIAR